MKIIFSWYISESFNDGVLRVKSHTLNLTESFKGCISSLLTDDEGLGLDFLTRWVIKGVEHIKKIQAGELEFYDWWGQAWGAEISKKNVKIYWGYDDTDYSDTMSFNSFAKIVLAWSDFIQSEPDLNKSVEIEFD